MRFGRSAVVASMLILAATCCSTSNVNAQAVEPGFTNGGCARQAIEEGTPIPTLSWAQVVRFDYQTQLGLMTARWFVPARVQPVSGRKAAVPTRLSPVWRKS